MVLKKEEVVLEYYVARNSLRTTCLRKCLNAKNESAVLSSAETDCLQNCGSKIRDYMEVVKEQYLKNQLG